jgi:serine/threonine protein kinase
MQLNLVRPLAPVALVAEYRILKVLGQGGFGTTYLAEDLSLCKQFALKEFTPHHLVGRQGSHLVVHSATDLEGLYAKSLKQFLSEGQHLGRLSHPNVVHVSRYLEANNTGYLVMDFEKGRSLRSLICDRKASMTESEIRPIVRALADGLAQMHRRQLIHRDVKPDNIIIRDDGEPVLIDFGAAVDFGGATSDYFDVVVTPGYAPPEQYDPRGRQGAWTDIYAFGATLYELVGGEPPPPVRRGVRAEMPPAAILGAGRFSTQLLMLIDKCLEPEIAARPQSLDQFLALLSSPGDKFIRATCGNTSLKMIQHFMNWWKPIDSVYTDEFVTFVVHFPMIDLSWRIGHALMTRDAVNALIEALDPRYPDHFEREMIERGFKARCGKLTHSLVLARIDEYSAAYLLDRQEPEWDYRRLCEQAARNCLTPTATHEREVFISLLRDVIDRARNRVKKSVRKEWEPYKFIWTEGGWERVLQTAM